MPQLKSLQTWHWRNRFCEHPVVVAEVEGGEAGYVNPVALAALRKRFPQVGAGHSPARLLAMVCLAMQREKYETVPAAHGVAATQLWFAAVDPLYAGVTLGAGAAFLNQVAARRELTVAEAERQVGRLVESCEFAATDQSTRAMAAEASRRGIPWFRIALGIPDIQLGQGFKQGRMCESMPNIESPLGIKYASNKALTYGMLSAAGLPVGKVGTASTPDEAVAFAEAMGYPVVLKPVDGGQGVGVVVGLTNPEAVRRTAETLLPSARRIIVQSFLPGEDHRLLVVAGHLVAAARRDPAAVVGDGAQSISQLIAVANQDPRRDVGYRKLMNFILVDDETRRVLATQGLSLESIPAAGRKVLLRLTANIHTGGTAADVTDVMHPDNVWLAERAAAIMGLTVAGVDLIIPDIAKSWREVGGGVCEVNSTVGLRPHWLADPTRDVEGPILETLFPDRDDGRIPTALVTGTNGKTTTTRMLDHILRAAGHVVGSATTDAVTINGRIVVEGDFAGASGAAMALNDPAVTAAVLETARGGVLRNGIGLERCDVAALLNIQSEQVGMDGVETLEGMARLKRKVVETARDAFVFNADDALCHAVSREFPIDRTILFSLQPAAAEVVEHLAGGGTVVTLDGRGRVVVRDRTKTIKVMSVGDIPATFDGRVRHNLANALAATALAHGMNIPAGTIAEGLAGFTATLEHSSGRFNFIDDLPVRTLVDFAANPPAITAVVAAAMPFMDRGARICMFTSPGNRPDSQIADCGRAVAHAFDHYVCFERVEYRRGRAEGEIAERLARALLAEGVAAERIARASTPAAGAALAAQLAQRGDFLLVLGAEIGTALPELRAAFAGRTLALA